MDWAELGLGAPFRRPYRSTLAARGFASLHGPGVMAITPPESGDVVVGQTFQAPMWPDIDLSDCVFQACVFTDGDFDSADLRGARFLKCTLTRCRFTHADARETVFDETVTADASTQRGVDFGFARLEEARFSRCELTQARFEGAELYAAAMVDCHLLGARFTRAKFFRAFGRSIVRAAMSFAGSNLELADLAGVNLEGCDLSRVRLRESDLTDANLEAANLMDADLFQAVIDGARLSRADLRGAQISGLDLRRLGSYQDLKIGPDQQFMLLEALGVDVTPD